MQVKSVVIRSFPSSIGNLRSLANSFTLRRSIRHGYTMPEDDESEIASHWNYVGKDLQIALNKYGQNSEAEQDGSVTRG